MKRHTSLHKDESAQEPQQALEPLGTQRRKYGRLRLSGDLCWWKGRGDVWKGIDFSQRLRWGQFPGGPVAKTSGSHCMGPGFDP